MIVFKFFTVAQFEQEEQWLNEMSGKGWQLQSVGLGYYTFQAGVAGGYQYKIELLPNSLHNAESQSYIGFLRDMGIECVATYFRWVYFRKQADSVPFVLYSDIPSNIKHYERIFLLCRVLYVINFITGTINLLAVLEQILNRPNGISTLNVVVVFANLMIAAILFAYSRPLHLRIKQMRKENGVRE